MSAQLKTKIWLLLSLLLLPVAVRAADVFPPAPGHYFNDFAGVASSGVATQLDGQLRKFEQDTSSQIVVAIFPKLDSDRPYDDYSIRLFNAWHIGQKGKDNGVGLFVYVADHKAFICTGKGMEGPLPDATAFAIISNEITPKFKAGDFNGGLTAGVTAIMAATRGEYKGSGTTVDQRNNGNSSDSGAGSFPAWLVIAFIIVAFLLRWYFGGIGYAVYSSGGRWGGGGFGGGGFGGGGFGGGGGGFSGGGGSSGGGGAGGSW